MQENNFEKQVQQKLDELNLTPSEPVWQKVEAALKKKRDRRLVFWFVPILLLAGGVAWWQMTTGGIKEQDTLRAPKTIHQHETFSKPHSGEPDQKAEIKITAIKQQNQVAKSSAAVSNNTLVIMQTEAIQATVATANNKNKTKATQAFFASACKEKNTNPKNTVTENKAVADINKTLPVSTQPITVTKEPAAQKIGPDSLNKTKNTNTDSLKKGVQPVDKNSQQKRKLQWSVVSNIGTSNAVEKIFSGFSMAKSLRQSSSPNGYTNGNAIPGTTYDSTRISPSLPQKGLQFSVGAIIKNETGKKVFLFAGLQYHFYSNHQVVGTVLPADSINRNTSNADYLSLEGRAYRNNGVQNKVTNTYHFIELPIGFEYRLLKNQSLAIQHGIAISRLIRSNVLQYDSGSNAYYQSKNGLRKTGINFFTAVDYVIWKNNAFALRAGPQLQLGLQNSFKTAPKSYLVSGGLAVSMDF